MAKTIIVTGRVNYIHITEPYAQDPKEDPMYSTCIIVGKKYAKAFIDEVEKWTEEEDTSEVYEPRYDEDGNLIINAKSKYKPAWRKSNGADGDIYNGEYCRVKVTPYTYDHRRRNHGIAFGLRALIGSGRGEEIKSDAFEGMEDFEDEKLPF